jgi:RNA polymerase sigma-70 factor (ECF subfamily)
VDGLRRGDRAAFEYAVRLLSPRLLATARTIVGNSHAEDVVQEAWFAVHRRIGEFQHRSRFSTWVTRIVVNKALDVRRGVRREEAAPEPDRDPAQGWFDEDGHWRPEEAADLGTAPDALLQADGLRACLQARIASLPEQQRLVLRLREVEQWSLEEIRNELELSPSNVRVLLHRARMKLMDVIQCYERTGTC